MSAPPPQTPALPLAAATLAVMLRDTISVLPYYPGTTELERAAQCEGAIAFLATLDPRDPLEAMSATHTAAAAYAAMHAFHLATRSDLTLAQRLRARGTAIGLMRLSAAARREIIRRPAVPAAPPATVPAARPQPAPAVPSTPALPVSPASPPDAAPGRRHGSVAPPRPANDA